MRTTLLILSTILVTTLATARQLPTFPPATTVLGQTGTNSALAPTPPTASSLAAPSAVVVDPTTGKVFVADTANHRVLRYPSYASLLTGAPAEYAFGQPNLTTNATAPVSPTSLLRPTGVWIDSTRRLWVADTDHNRVVVFANATSRTDAAPAATVTLGQPDLSSATPTTTITGMTAPRGLTIDATGRLWVADTGNNRVLEFEAATSLATGAPATGVLGQATYDTSAPRADQLGLRAPAAVSVDATRTLWVADTGNHRILGYPSAGTISDGTNAARVIGQPDFNVTIPGTTDRKLSSPTGVFADGRNNLWVLDGGNSRALRYSDLAPLNNGAPASILVGQPNFTTDDPALEARRLDHPLTGIFVDPADDIWIGDTGNNRVLRFGQIDSEIPKIQAKGKRKARTRRGRITLQGTASDDTAVTQVLIKIKGKRALRPATGTDFWKTTVRLKRGKRNVFKAIAYDAVGNRSTPAKVIRIRR